MTTLADSLSWIRTNADGRAALNVIATGLQNAYALLPDVTSSQGLRATAQKGLDDANLYAQQIYSDIPNDDGDLSIWNSGRIGICASQADGAINGVTDAAGVSRFDFGSAIKQAATEVGSDISSAADAVGKIAGDAAAAPFQGLIASLTAFLHGARVALLVGGVVIGVYVLRRPILRAVGRGVA